MVSMFIRSGVLALLCMAHVATQEQFVFKHVIALSGFRCVASAKSVGVVRSKIMCAGACKRDVGCKAFFHDVTSGECFTYGTVPTSTAGCSVRHGAFFKKPGGVFGDACASNAGCTLSGMECIDSTCQCSDPLKFDPGSGNCVTQCATYGTTYTWRPLIKRENTVNLETLGIFTTLSDCMNRCSSTDACTGVKFTHAIGPCVLKQETASSYSVIQLLGLSDWYSRNCV
ncbi:uncharacterized protein LOC127841448 [Dreissena polymorpha]|nr:uncharacterized protein LOC127841448 [Dreissena polymorpha]